MSRLVPHRFLFEFEFPLRYLVKSPRLDGHLRDWSDNYLLPALHELDGPEATGFAPVWAGWNDSGLFIACRVRGKRQPLRCDPATFWKGDNLRLCTDMRDTRNIRRASRYCQQFYLLPTGGGRSRNEPIAGGTRFRQARENAPDVPASAIRIASVVEPDGYSLEAHIPAAVLNGFDPAEHPRIGFYYILEDQDLGQQYLTVGDELDWHVDPSTWATAVLTR